MRHLKYIPIIVFMMLFKPDAMKAQLNPFGSIYFFNPYLANPAYAGADRGFSVGTALKASWTAIENAPVSKAVTLDYGFNSRKVGLGLIFFNDQAGILNRSSLKAVYAYHMAFNKSNTSIDFGLSGGIMDEWIDFNKVRGQMDDADLMNFNQRKLYLDSDFGMAIRTNNITVQAVLPNLKRYLDRDVQKDLIDVSRFMVSAGYRFQTEKAQVFYAFEPKVMYRDVQNFRSIVDLGANVEFYEGRLKFNGIYHSTNSMTFGVGTTYRNSLSILCLYNSNTADMQNYANGEFELSLKYGFGGVK